MSGNAASRISFGIAGWSYPDWNGIVYPPGEKDPLGYIARFVDCVEINSTFYRPPSASNAGAWLKRVERLGDFFFCAKLHREITHEGRVAQNMVDAFRSGLQPLAGRGRLRHLLGQFRYDFEDSPAHRLHLESITDSFSGLANLVLELRHVSWQAGDALRFLDGLGATVANLDYPLAHNSFSLRLCRVGRHRYLRLHGRNRAAWFSAGVGRDEAYNYNYSAAELKDIAARAVELASDADSLVVIGNNHFQGKEVANIIKLKAMVLGVKLPVPEGLKRHYPELDEIDASA